jgi:hypothetical protein
VDNDLTDGNTQAVDNFLPDLPIFGNKVMKKDAYMKALFDIKDPNERFLAKASHDYNMMKAILGGTKKNAPSTLKTCDDGTLVKPWTVNNGQAVLKVSDGRDLLLPLRNKKEFFDFDHRIADPEIRKEVALHLVSIVEYIDAVTPVREKTGSIDAPKIIFQAITGRYDAVVNIIKTFTGTEVPKEAYGGSYEALCSSEYKLPISVACASVETLISEACEICVKRELTTRK